MAMNGLQHIETEKVYIDWIGYALQALKTTYKLNVVESSVQLLDKLLGIKQFDMRSTKMATSRTQRDTLKIL